MSVAKYKQTFMPSKPEISLSREVYDYLVWLVPEGKLTTDAAIRDFLSKISDCGWIDFELPIIKLSTVDGFAQRLVEIVPHHRIVSSMGYVSDPSNVEKLIKEGFEIEAPKGNRGFRVKNHKKHLFCYETVENLNSEFIARIQKEGIERFIPMNLEF